MQPFENIPSQRQQHQDVAPTRQPAAFMQILNARPHPARRAVQPNAVFNPHAPPRVIVQSPQEVDFLGHFEDDPTFQTSHVASYAPPFSQNQVAPHSYFAPYPIAAQCITVPCADTTVSEFNLAQSPDVVDFDRSGSFGQVSFGPYSDIDNDRLWLGVPAYGAKQSFSSEGFQISNSSVPSGNVSSFTTCPSMTDHSWNSPMSNVQFTPRSCARPGSFDAELTNDSFAQLQDQYEGSEPFHNPDLEIPHDTWRNSDTSGNYPAVEPFSQSKIPGNGVIKIPIRPAYSAGRTNQSQPCQFLEYENTCFDFEFPTKEVSLSHDETQQLQFEVEDEEFPRRSSARANPLKAPFKTKNSLTKGNAFVNGDDTNFSHDCFVMENDLHGNLKTELPKTKGSRNKPLSPEKAKTTAERRKNGTTCMRCRTMRVECDGGNPCQRCVKAADSLSLMYPCIKAAFLEIVISGTCNYISQRAINHFTLDECRRIQMFLPKEFDIDQLLNLLSTRRHIFNIRARQKTGSLYVLDLAKCYTFLKTIRRSLGSSKQADLRDFIDNTLAGSSPWRDCVRECDPVRDRVALLSKWNNMPSRASYDIVSLEEGVPDRTLDPEDEQDKKEIMIAAQVSRIICRKAEIDGYRALQTTINNATRSANPDEKIQFVQELGRLLCSLRWRMSWWELLGDGSREHDPFRERFIDRVKLLSRVLYFYFFTVKDKVPPWCDTRGLQGVWSSYPDSRPVFDDFPIVCSIEAFEEWMDRGKGLIREADVQGRFSR